MPSNSQSCEKDAHIARAMASGNRQGLELFLAEYGGRLRGYLLRRYGACLQESDLEEALSAAIFNIWRFADRYDSTKASLGSWAIRIAQRTAQDVIRRELRHRTLPLDVDLASLSPRDNNGLPASRDVSRERLLADLDDAIQQLPPLQKAIILADLAAGADGIADAGRLARALGTSKGSIYVSRIKARENVYREMVKRGQRPGKGECEDGQ